MAAWCPLMVTAKWSNMFAGVRTGSINPGEPVGSLAHFSAIHTSPEARRAPLKVTRQYARDCRHAEEMTEDT